MTQAWDCQFYLFRAKEEVAGKSTLHTVRWLPRFIYIVPITTATSTVWGYVLFPAAKGDNV